MGAQLSVKVLTLRLLGFQAHLKKKFCVKERIVIMCHSSFKDSLYFIYVDVLHIRLSVYRLFSTLD